MPTSTLAKVARTDAGLASVMRLSIMRLARRLRNERDPSDDLTPNQLAVLGTLSRNDALSLGELAAAERVQPPSMTRIVNNLCEKGLLQRSPDPTDGRVVLLSLSEQGKAVVYESRRRKEAWLYAQIRALTPDERRTLREAVPILERLSQA